MKRIVWLGAAALLALAAAIPLWLVLDGGGERRTAALVTETPPVGGGRLTIAGVNQDKPFNLQSYSWGAEREGKVAQLGELEFTRFTSEISPQLWDVAAPSATLELLTTDRSSGNTVVSLIYEFKDVTIVSYEDEGARVVGGNSAAAAAASQSRTTARMTFGSVTERFAYTPPQDPAELGRMTVSTRKGAVPIIGHRFGFQKGAGGGVTSDTVVVTREVDAMTPWFLQAVTDGTPAGTDVTIELIGTQTQAGKSQTYAVYELTNATVRSVRDFDTTSVDTGPQQEVELSFASVRMTSGDAVATLAGP